MRFLLVSLEPVAAGRAGSILLSTKEAVLVVTAAHAAEVMHAFIAGVDYVENMLRSQLQARAVPAPQPPV